MPQMIAAPTFQLPQLQAFSGGAQTTEAVANLANQLLQAYLKKQELNKGEAASSELADIMTEIQFSRDPRLSLGPVQDPSAYAAPPQAEQYQLLTDALLDSEFSQNRARGVDLQMQKLSQPVVPKKPPADRTQKYFKDGQTWEVMENWDATENAWVRDEKSARPVDDEAYRLDLIGNITTNQLLSQQTPIPDDATAEQRTMITAADSYHNLTEKIKLLTNHPEHGNLLKMDEVKDLEEEKEAARLIFQGPTAEEQLQTEVRREEALSKVSPQAVPVSEERLRQDIQKMQTPVLGPGERFKKDPTTGEVTDEIELVPGSANWRKRNASRQKALRAYKEFDAKTENNLARIDRVVDFYDDDWLSKKGLLALGAVIPGLEWKTIQNEIMSLRGVIGFDQLQAMREVSPTGGALGQVSTFELDNLQAILGRLDPKDPAGLVRNLRQIRDIYSGMTGNLRDAYNKDYGLLGDEYMIKEPEAKGKDTILRWDPKLDDGKGSIVEEER